MSSKKQLEKLSKGFELPRPPERSTVSEEAAARFLEPESRKAETKKARPTRKKPSDQHRKQPDSQKGEGKSRLRRNESGERMSIYLPPDIAEKLRVRCALDRRSLSDAVTEAVVGWLD